MAPAIKVCGKELVHDLPCHVIVDEPSRHHQDIRVIVLADQVGDLWHPA